jgi:hypothetical protein
MAEGKEERNHEGMKEQRHFENCLQFPWLKQSKLAGVRQSMLTGTALQDLNYLTARGALQESSRKQ